MTTTTYLNRAAGLLAALALACSGSPAVKRPDPCAALTCSAHASCISNGTSGSCVCDPGMLPDGTGACVATTSPALGGCALFPPDFLFNTPIAALPALATETAAWRTSIGDHPLHLDLGTTVDMASAQYWGIPYNVAAGNGFTWPRIYLGGGSPDESDCAAQGAQGTIVSPCTIAAPVAPVPASPLVEGGISASGDDHHILIVDSDTCRLWELYHANPHAGGGWSILSSAVWSLGSNALRPDGWTSGDAAGFPILPLLLRQGEAASGTIRHALRFTLPNALIRNTKVWPARHVIGSVTGASAVPMGQLFRLRADYPMPANVQSRAILQAMKTYGLYLADAGSTWYVQGEPSAAWDDAIFSDVQAVRTADLEAVDLLGFTGRVGWSNDSGRVPPP
jgi:hypothetical protein